MTRDESTSGLGVYSLSEVLPLQSSIKLSMKEMGCSPSLLCFIHFQKLLKILHRLIYISKKVPIIINFFF